jgi:histidyl-tRNA synthetase
VAESLRSHGLSVLMHAASAEGQGSMKSQFRRADASGARFALVFGAQELAAGSVSVKPLRDDQAAQTTHLLADLAQWAVGLRAA